MQYIYYRYYRYADIYACDIYILYVCIFDEYVHAIQSMRVKSVKNIKKKNVACLAKSSMRGDMWHEACGMWQAAWWSN